MGILSDVLRRFAGSASLAVWAAFLPTAFDLAHPVFSDCGRHPAGEEAANGAEAPASRTGAEDDAPPAEHASDRDCPVHGDPARDGVPCCGDGGCFCSGAPAVPAPATRLLRASARHERFAPVAFGAADGVSRPVFHPPRA